MSDITEKQMKRMFKNVFGIVLAIAIIVSSLSAGLTALAAEFTVDGNIIGNEYVEIAVNTDNPLFTIGTTGGDPLLSTDDYKKLIYGHPFSETSYTTVVIDGLIYMYGVGDEYIQLPTFNADEGSNVSSIRYGDIIVTQTLKIIKNSATGRKDLVEISYDITNTGTVAHDIGTRIMLDTMLGSNDAAPFRVPGVGDVTTQMEFEGDEIPQYWQVFDSLTAPNVVAQGTFIGTKSNRPDKVQFTNWGNVMDNPWEQPVYPGQANGDSAVTATWYETMAPGETRTYATYYGMSVLETVETDCLAISLFAPAEIEVESNLYVPNPTTITAYVTNTSSNVVENAQVTLDVAYPFSINAASAQTVSLGSIAPGEEKQVSWLVDIMLTESGVYVPVTAEASAPDVDSVSATKTVFVPGIENTYSITYYVGTEVYKTDFYDEGDAVIAPSDPSVEGYTFLGWINSATGEEVIPSTMPAENLVYVAKLDANTYTATFKVDGSVYAEIETDFADIIPVPADPSKEGMIFAGWTPAVPATMPAYDCEFNATWVSPEEYTVTYLVDGKTYQAYEVEEGAEIPVPEDPEKFGFEFVGWTPSIPYEMPAEDLVFEAEWKVDECLIAVVAGGAIIGGATAAGIVASSNAAWITAVSVVGGVAAVWVIGKYVVPEIMDTHKVTYKVDGETYKVYIVKTGEAIDVPEDPSKDGMTFAGWTPEIPDVMPDNDLVFDATWEDGAAVETEIPATGSSYSTVLATSAAAGLAIAVIAVLKKKRED